MDEKKKYEAPEADVVEFNNEDIVTLSNGGELGDWGDGTGEDY